jgi:hypothetical protein
MKRHLNLADPQAPGPPPDELTLLRVVVEKAEGVIKPTYIVRLNDWMKQLEEAVREYRRHYPK